MINSQMPSIVAQSELEPGEYLLWSGRPDAWSVSRMKLLILLFAIPWTAFSVFWMVMAAWGVASMDNPLGYIFPLFGLPFVAVGVGMLAMPYIAYRRAQNTVYAVTDRRAMIIVAGKNKTVESYMPSDFSNITRLERANGSGDLIFMTVEKQTRKGQSRLEAIGFFGIPDVSRVERIFIDAFKPRARNSAFGQS